MVNAPILNLLPTQDPNFPLTVGAQEDPASRSLTFTAVVLNGGLLLGWVVGVATGGLDASDILAGIFALLVFSALISVGWYRFLRSRYGLGFYLLGTEPGRKEAKPTHEGYASKFISRKWESFNSKFASRRFSTDSRTKVAPSESLPSVISKTEKEDEVHVMIGPSEDILSAAENEIRGAMEDGSPEDIFSAVETHSALREHLGPDLVWAAGILQMRLSTAATALERLKENIREDGGGARIDDVQSKQQPQQEQQHSRPVTRGDGTGTALTQLAETTALILAEEPSDSSKVESEKRELLAQLEGMRSAIEQLQAYKLVQQEELFVVTRRNLQHKLELGEMKDKMEEAEVAAALSQKERMDLIMEMKDRALLASALRQRIAAVSSEKLIKRVSDLHDATKLCNTIIHHIEATLDVTAYASRSPAFKSGEGSKGETPKVDLTLFATGPTMRPLLHSLVVRGEARLSYEALNSHKTLHISNLQDDDRICWLRPDAQGESGHLLLIPLAATAVGGTLGVLAVDTLRQQNRHSVDFIPEEQAALEYAAQQMAKALLRARSVQSEVHSSMLEAINMEPEGWAGLMMQRMELLRMKQRLDAVLTDGTPETRACLAEMKTYKQPSRPFIAVCSAVLMLIRPKAVERQFIERFQRVGLPTYEDVLEAFWKEYVQPNLIQVGDTLMSQLQAVDFRHMSDKKPFEHLAGILDSIAPHFGGSGVLGYMFPWLKCLLALQKIVVIPGESESSHPPGVVDAADTSSDSMGGLLKSVDTSTNRSGERTGSLFGNSGAQFTREEDLDDPEGHMEVM